MQQHSSDMVIYFDGECNFCNGTINFIIRKDKQQHFKFASLQSAQGQLIKEQIDNKTLDSLILRIGEKIYTHSDAALHIAKYLHSPYNWLYIFIVIPKFIRNGIYSLVAQNRYKWFGKADTCMVPSPELRNRFL